MRTLVARPLCALLALSVLAACGEPDAPATKPPAAAPDVDPHVPLRRVLIAHRESKPPAERSRAEAKALADEVVRRLRAPGASFEAIAREHSDDRGSAQTEGFAGFLGPRSTPPPDVMATIAALSPGEVSEPLATPFGYEILQRLSRQEGKRLEERWVVPVVGFFVPWSPLDPGQPQTRTKSVAYQQAALAVAALRRGASIAESAGEAGGGMDFRGAMKPGVSDPGLVTVERAAFALAPGEWSDPVESAKGWAVIRRDPYFRARVKNVLVAHSMSKLPEPPKRGRVEASERANQALARVAADPKSWDAVVAEFSDEPGAASRGGAIGDVTNAADDVDRAVPELEEAVRLLSPGRIGTHLVESRFGFHILWRID